MFFNYRQTNSEARAAFALLNTLSQAEIKTKIENLKLVSLLIFKRSK